MGELETGKHYTIEEYLRLEEQATERHEYENGLILEMSGGTINHSAICSNVGYALESAVRKNGSGCRVYNSDLRIRIEKVDSFVYPDVAISCGKIERALTDIESLINPIVVVEVLSKSTEGYDYGEKFQKYMTLDTLQEYVLVNQYRPIVQVFNRQNAEMWGTKVLKGLEAVLHLQSLDLDISLADIYYNIQGLETQLWVREEEK